MQNIQTSTVYDHGYDHGVATYADPGPLGWWYASLHSHFHEYLWSHDAGKAGIVGKTILHNHMCQYIMNKYTCFEPSHYLAWIVVCFPTVTCIKTLLHGLDPYITFMCHVLRCPVLITMQWSVVLWSVLSIGREETSALSLSRAGIEHNLSQW